MTTDDINAIRPATDLLIGQLRETLGEIQAHEHPDGGSMPDLYCLNLTSWLGERMGPVLRRLADEQAETRKWQERNTALADEFAAETDRLHAELDAIGNLAYRFDHAGDRAATIDLLMAIHRRAKRATEAVAQ